MKKYLSIGLVRGMIGQVIGMALGFGPGHRHPGDHRRPAQSRTGLGGRRFYRRALLSDLPGRFPRLVPHGQGRGSARAGRCRTSRKAGWRYWGLSFDHKVIGVQYGFLSLFLLAVGGTFALIFRVELAQTGLHFLSFNLFNTLVGLHGMVLIASILMGISAISNYTIPLLIGARDMAFPRLNAFSFWVAVPGALLLVFSLALGGFETGWTGYPPLSIRGPMGVQMFFLGVWFVGWSSILGALNLIATIIRMRTPGMTMFRMPILAWSVLATSMIALNATQLIGLSFQLVAL